MRLIPNENLDFAYTVNFFRVQNGGTIRLQTSGGDILTINVRPGAYVYLPVRRIFQVGTSASGFQTEQFSNNRSANYYMPVPYNELSSDVISGVILLSQGGGAVLTSDGRPIFYVLADQGDISGAILLDQGGGALLTDDGHPLLY